MCVCVCFLYASVLFFILYNFIFMYLCILIVMYVLFCVFCLTVLFCVLFVCKCVLDCCHRDIGALYCYPN
jgi:hypothetical protein